MAPIVQPPAASVVIDVRPSTERRDRQNGKWLVKVEAVLSVRTSAYRRSAGALSSIGTRGQPTLLRLADGKASKTARLTAEPYRNAQSYRKHQ
jgi:hypothetical protein